jgi:hypothetical protein
MMRKGKKNPKWEKHRNDLRSAKGGVEETGGPGDDVIHYSLFKFKYQINFKFQAGFQREFLTFAPKDQKCLLFLSLSFLSHRCGR